MTARARPLDAAFIEDIENIHAADVMRARALILEAVAKADAEWLPRNATAEALLSVLAEVSQGANVGCAHPDKLS